MTTQEGSSVGKFFLDGSDIEGNYPILIGLAGADYRCLKTAAYVARYESRIGDPIPLSAFTHLEVPAAKVAEATRLLKKHGYDSLPVFAFEQCEQLHSRKHFSTLVG